MPSDLPPGVTVVKATSLVDAVFCLSLPVSGKGKMHVLNHTQERTLCGAVAPKVVGHFGGSAVEVAKGLIIGAGVVPWACTRCFNRAVGEGDKALTEYEGGIE